MLAGAVAVLALAAAAGRELDPAACSARFDVQRNKIIRTEESRDMGARYLSELDVGSRAECLRLCCETDACDVFVYEEKSPGSCYLFACGPPEDFRCKFTSHGNFSAGVLQLSRRLAELQDQERAPPPRPAASAPPPPPPPPVPTTHRSTTSTTSTTPPPPPRITSAPYPPTPPVTQCSRYEFACASGGECVAVYNACDGVAQCADASDEAPLLACPPPRAPHAPNAPPPPPIMPPREEARQNEHWPHRLTQAQPPRHYPEDDVRIFSHTGGLLNAPPAVWRNSRPHPQGMEGMEGWEAGGWEPRRSWPVPPAPLNEHLIGGDTMPELPPVYEQEGAPHDAPKKGPPEQPPTPPPTTTTLPTTTRTHEKPVTSAPSLSQARVDIERHDIAEDGHSERAPAAMMLLILGVGVTIALMAALGCGARRQRRRRRQHHSHDYLVNGMYL